MNPPNFGKYQLVKKLATGGMAEVWLARQTGIEGFSKEVVVKRILPHLADDPEFIQMFLNEAKISSRFNHPNIAQIFDFGRVDTTSFIAMEFIRGEDLGRVMRKAWSSGQWIARPLAIRIVAACCEGLYYAHNQSDEEGRPLRVVHRDISPQNILISFDGGVKLVDFGIAKAADVASMTKSGAIKGKFAYMSPEQAAGKPLDHRSDIFAIGLVLYELLTGVRPLKRDSELGTLQAALECSIEPPSAVADVPNELDDVVMHALTKAADDRYRDARGFQMALEEFLVSQRWVATSVQISELMETLFAERIQDEKRLGHPNPPTHDGQSSQSLPPVPPPPPKLATPPRQSQPATPARSSSKTATPQVGGAAAQQNSEDWGAPPSEPAPSDTRPMSAMRRNSREALPAAENWEAPPGEMQKGASSGGRRNSVSNDPVPPAQARGGSRVNSPKQSQSNPALRRATQAQMEADNDGERTEMGHMEEEEPPAPPPPPRTTSSQGVPRRRTSTGVKAAPAAAAPSGEPSRKSGQYSLGVRKGSSEMPEAPPPRNTEDDDEESIGGRRAPSNEQLYAQMEKSEARARRLGVLRNMVIALIVLLGVGAAWVNREKVLEVIKPRGQYFVSADSNLTVMIKVRHKASEKKEDETLGQTPLSATPGAHPGDTIIFESKAIGAYSEEKLGEDLPLGQAVALSKEFKKGRLRLHVSPEKKVGSLLVLRDGQQVGTFPGLDIELVEGKHMLELRGNKLRKPAMVEVTVKGNSTVDSKTFDLGAVITD